MPAAAPLKSDISEKTGPLCGTLDTALTNLQPLMVENGLNKVGQVRLSPITLEEFRALNWHAAKPDQD